MTGQDEFYHADLSPCGHGTDPSRLAATPPRCRAGQVIGWVQPALEPADPPDPEPRP